jgi:GDPmannose 4,6-dehydratase
MFGATSPPQSESSAFYPRSPYGASKVYGFWMTKNYREAYGLFAVNGILFNHESPRRGETFVTRKISRAVARISLGLQKNLYLGNLNAIRDWGFAPEYVEGMWRMLQHSEPEDYVLATGKAYSVREFLQASFAAVNLDWEKFIEYDSRYERPTEVHALIGDASKAADKLGWVYKTDALEMAKLMVESDIKLIQNPTMNVADPSPRYWD